MKYLCCIEIGTSPTSRKLTLAFPLDSGMESTGGVGHSEQDNPLWPHRLLLVIPLRQGTFLLQVFLILREIQLALKYAN